MSRKISNIAVNAFLAGSPMKQANMQISIEQFESKMYLHHNLIATKDMAGNIRITNAGWASNTTKERLNAIPGVSISQKKGVWYLNGTEWDGSWITIS